MFTPFTQISSEKNNPLSRFASWSLMAFVALAIASCATTGDGVESAGGQNDTTLKVDDVNQDVREISPLEPSDWFVSQGVFRTRLFVKFNKPVDTTTFNHITFKYTITSQGDSSGVVMTGGFQFNDSKTIVGFESDKSLAEFLGRPVRPAENFNHQLRLRGTHGSITDTDGNVWPFSGIYSAPDANSLGGLGTTSVNSRPRSKLLDGDDNDEPGGSFLQNWVIIG